MVVDDVAAEVLPHGSYSLLDSSIGLYLLLRVNYRKAAK